MQYIVFLQCKYYIRN